MQIVETNVNKRGLRPTDSKKLRETENFPNGLFLRETDLKFLWRHIIKRAFYFL